MNIEKLSDQEFVSFLFDKLLTNVDTDFIDLHDDDAAMSDVLEFQQLVIDF